MSAGAELDPDLAEMAHDELLRAMTLSWGQLSHITPWGDTYDGISPAGRNVRVERNYLWADAPGADILCEVTVFANDVLYDQGARVSAILAKGSS